MSDLGYTKFFQFQERAEYGRACEIEKRKNGLIVNEQSILECMDRDLRDCGI